MRAVWHKSAKLKYLEHLFYFATPHCTSQAPWAALVCSASQSVTMLEGMDRELLLFVNTLGITVVLLLVAYHFVTARARDAEQ